MGAKLRSAWTQRPGEFLAHLWPLFGKPETSDDGFTYTLEDLETGTIFKAYTAASGPSYAGADHVPAVLDAFEKLLRATPPVECEFVITSFEGFLPEKIRVGWKAGATYFHPDTRKPVPRVKTIADCERRVLAIAKKLEKHYGREMLAAAWGDTLAREISPPEEFEWQGRTFENVVAVMLGKRGKPVLVVDEGDGLEELPLGEVLAGDPTARLWCEAYETWRKNTKRARR